MESSTPPSFIAHLENFINPDRSEAEHVKSSGTIISLVLKGTVSIQQVVLELGAYLTTTDNAIRARGILLLAEVMKGLSTTKLTDVVVHNMAIFFAARLAEWHGLRGAVLGSLALLKRPNSVGAVQKEDALIFAKSALENLHVQALTQQDRILCLELLEILLGTYAAAVSSLGSNLVHGVIAAIEGETDPRCLLLSFHLVELLVHLFPDPSGPIADCAEDLFDIIGRYFPISFSPPPNDKWGITREDLSTSLQKAFGSTPLFSSSCIALLLEKLSSSLRVAKMDSLKYLGLCALDFGGEVIAAYSKSIWEALKSELLPSSVTTKGIFDIILLSDRESYDETFICLRHCVKAFSCPGEGPVTVDFPPSKVEQQNFLSLIIEDDLIGDLFRFMENSASSSSLAEMVSDGDRSAQFLVALFKEEGNTSRARMTIDIVSSVAQVSLSACSFTLNKLLHRAFLALQGLCSSFDSIGGKGSFLSSNAESNQLANLVALLLSTKLVDAAKSLAQDQANTFSGKSHSCDSDELSRRYWLEPLSVQTPDLVNVFIGAIAVGKQVISSGTSKRLGVHYCQLGVDGLQVLLIFPGRLSPLSSGQVDKMVSFLTTILLEKEHYGFIWDYVLRAFSYISAFEEEFAHLESSRTYVLDEVIPQLLKTVTQLEGGKDIQAILHAISTISSSRPAVLPRVLDTLGDSVAFCLSGAIARSELSGVEKKAELLLRCISQDLLPLYNPQKGELAAAQKILTCIWSSVQALPVPTFQYSDQIVTACMEVSRIVVKKSSASAQEEIVLKALQIIADRVKKFKDYNTKKSGALCREDICKEGIPALFTCSSCYQEIQETWILGLLSSIVTAIRPGLLYLQDKSFIKLFLDGAHDIRGSAYTESAAQALSSILNKWVIVQEENNLSTCLLSLEDCVDFVLKDESLASVKSFMNPNALGNLDSSEQLSLHRVQLQGVRTLSWVGKGLAMRSHLQVKDVAVLLVSILTSTHTEAGSPLNHVSDGTNMESEEHKQSKIAILNAAAEGLGIIVQESKALNKDDHAIVRPLYKQRFLKSMLPLFLQALREGGNNRRIWLFRGLGHLISETPHAVLMSDVQLVLPLLLEALPALSRESRDTELLLSMLLVLSSFLVDPHNGRSTAADHVTSIVTRLISLLQYTFPMAVRETVLQSLGAVIGLPYSQVYPLRIQVLKALTLSLDDPKRSVRKEAVRCRRIWMAVSSK